MATETKLRKMIAGSLNKARTKIRSYTGLYTNDALVRGPVMDRHQGGLRGGPTRGAACLPEPGGGSH